MTPAVITQCDTRLLAAEKLRAEGGAASQLLPSKAGCFHSPVSTGRMRLALKRQSWGGETPTSSQLKGLSLTPPSHCYLRPAGERGGHLMQLLPQATQMAERPFPRDLRFKSGLDEGSAYPEEMNWELRNFRQQQEA